MTNTKIYKSDLLTPDELISAAIHKAIPDAVKLGLDTHSYWMLLRGFSVLDEKEMEFLQRRKSVPLVLMIKIVLVAYEAFPYPVSSDCHIRNWRQYGEKEDIYQWCWNAALQMGLVDTNVGPDELTSKSQLRSVVQILEADDCPAVPKGSFVGMNLLPEHTGAHSWTWRNGILLGLEHIPKTYLDMFVNRGWRITYDPIIIKNELAADYAKHMSPPWINVGRCDLTEKKIQIVSFKSCVIVWAMGQFVVKVKGISSRQKRLFEEEGRYIRQLPNCIQGNYFAAFWETWILNPQKRAALEKAAPKTAKIIKKLYNC